MVARWDAADAEQRSSKTSRTDGSSQQWYGTIPLIFICQNGVV
jgi:hypothetical protein